MGGGEKKSRVTVNKICLLYMLALETEPQCCTSPCDETDGESKLMDGEQEAQG